jgi:hypothetical protein
LLNIFKPFVNSNIDHINNESIKKLEERLFLNEENNAKVEKKFNKMMTDNYNSIFGYLIDQYHNFETRIFYPQQKK